MIVSILLLGALVQTYFGIWAFTFSSRIRRIRMEQHWSLMEGPYYNWNSTDKLELNAMEMARKLRGEPDPKPVNEEDIQWQKWAYSLDGSFLFDEPNQGININHLPESRTLQEIMKQTGQIRIESIKSHHEQEWYKHIYMGGVDPYLAVSDDRSALGIAKKATLNDFLPQPQYKYITKVDTKTGNVFVTKVLIDPENLVP